MIKDDTVRAEIELDKGEMQVFRDTYFAAVQNQPYEGGGFKFCPEADPGDRKLDVIVVSGLKRWQVIRTLLLAFQGKHVGHKGISIFRCEEVKIRFSQARAVHTDGEAVFLKKEIRMHILAAAGAGDHIIKECEEYVEISDRMYPDRNWRVFLYDFPGNGKKTGDLEIQRNTVGTQRAA